jgi:hypothetical protein
MFASSSGKRAFSRFDVNFLRFFATQSTGFAAAPLAVCRAFRPSAAVGEWPPPRTIASRSQSAPFGFCAFFAIDED